MTFKNLKKLICLVLTVFLMLASTLSVGAISAQELGTEFLQVDYTFDNETLSEALRLSQRFFNNTAVSVTAPLTVYNADFDSIFFVFPVIGSNECIALIHVDTMGSMTLSTNIELYQSAVELPSEQYLLYVSGGECFAESTNGTIKMADTGLSINTDNSYEQLSFLQKEALLYSEYAVAYTDVPVCDEAVCFAMVEDEVTAIVPQAIVPVLTVEVCNITNFVIQNHDMLCWAACIATIVNYEDGTTYSATGVADALGTSYAPLSAQHTAVALGLFGHESTVAGKITWAKVKNRINADRPFIMGLQVANSNIGHMITGYGYEHGSGDTSTAERMMYAWDPMNSQLFFNYYDTYITLYGYQYQWAETVYY